MIDFATLAKELRTHHLPLAFVDLDALDANAQHLVERANGYSIRMASKSLRCVSLMRRVFEKQSQFRGLLAYSAAEAAQLAHSGFDDIVIAYPSVDGPDLHQAAEVSESLATICYMVDLKEHVELLNSIGQAHGKILRVALDLDLSTRFPFMHFGVQRSALRDVGSAVRLAEHIASAPWLRLDGLMGYEAQIAGVADRLPGQPLKSLLIRLLKKLSMPRVKSRRQAVVAALEERFGKLSFVNAGGTGSLEDSATDKSITELTAGSGLYGPALFDHYQLFSVQPAVGFALPVTRKPEQGIFTCHGGGYIASGATGFDRSPVVFHPPDGALLPLEGAGEVQTPIRSAFDLQVGDPVFFRHAKAGELCERFTSIVMVQQGKVVGEVPTYRGEGWCFV